MEGLEGSSLAMQLTVKERIRINTPSDVQSHIDGRIENSIRFYSTQSKSDISDRIDELDAEWDVERLLEANAAGLGLGSLVMGLLVNKKWFFMTGAVLGLLLQNSVQGWCPATSGLRRMGARTRDEIDREKFALKALRGDFEHIAAKTENNHLLRAHDAILAAKL